MSDNPEVTLNLRGFVKNKSQSINKTNLLGQIPEIKALTTRFHACLYLPIFNRVKLYIYTNLYIEYRRPL